MSADSAVAVQVALTVAGCPLRNEIQQRVTTAVTALADVTSVSLDFTVMTDQEREAVRLMLHGNPGASAGQGQAHGHAQAGEGGAHEVDLAHEVELHVRIAAEQVRTVAARERELAARLFAGADAPTPAGFPRTSPEP